MVHVYDTGITCIFIRAELVLRIFMCIIITLKCELAHVIK